MHKVKKKFMYITYKKMFKKLGKILWYCVYFSFIYYSLSIYLLFLFGMVEFFTTAIGNFMADFLPSVILWSAIDNIVLYWTFVFYSLMFLYAITIQSTFIIWCA